jgi:RimJ/RimL family protein N-acetyltransferase
MSDVLHEGGDVLHEGGGVTVRVATRADSPALCDLLRRVHIRSNLDLTQERDPDFFRLLDMHLGEHEVLIAEGRDGRAGACGALSIRPGWVDGRIENVGYLGDLRIVPGSRAAAVMPKVFAKLLERARDRLGAQVFYTVIFDENEAAKRSLVERSEKRKGLPIYRVMTPFEMTNVQFTTSKGRPGAPVERASRAGLDELIAFLAERARSRVMGDPCDAARMMRRLETWPLAVDSFLIARRSGRIAGCAAPFDTDPFKRTRVLGYYGRMRWIRTAFDLGAAVLRYPPLPAPGETFRFAFLSHLEVRDDDPAVLRDLLLEAYRQRAGDGLHFLSAMVPRGSPLARAFSGFTVNRTPMTIYSVTLADGPHAERDFETMRPGFEMALS